MLLEKFAAYYAGIKHAGQLYGTGEPFTAHLYSVVQEVKRWAPQVFKNVTPDDIEMYSAIAWLHDVMEDCGTTKKELRWLFSDYVAEIVWKVTDEPGQNRAERHQKTYPKIAEDSTAIFIKLCDRIANIQSAWKTGSPLLKMYVEEHPEFKKALQVSSNYDIMWNYIDNIFNSNGSTINVTKE